MDTLDISIGGGKAFLVKNDRNACEELAARLPRPCVVHIESSGGHERLVARVLRASGIEVRTHDPLRVKRISQARAGKAKTDPIDARNLASAGRLLPVRTPKTVEHDNLADHSRAIEALKDAAREFLVRARSAQLDSVAQSAYLDAAQTLRMRAETLERQFVARVKASSHATRYELALSVEGVGPCMARVCVAELPEDLTHLTTAQIAAYAGLAPIDNSSGRHTGRSRLGRGNSHLKGGCYMPAVSAVRHQPWATALYTRLKAKGRLHQQAIVAVMRRMLVRVAAVLKRGSPWEAEPVRA